MLAIESTVGAGKTTFGQFLSEKTGIKLYEELVNNDTNVLLDKFYAKQKRWSFALQIHFLNDRFKMIKEINKLESGILDRSIYGDSIFAELLHEDGKMSKEEYNTYKSLLTNMLEHITPPQLLIYLECSTDTAIQRIAKRNRGIETEVPINYWLRLNEKYDSWYNNYNLSEKICLNVDNFNIFDEKQREEFLNVIVDKLKKF
jgi:deoxyadenosine/deoxycytidine kinase